MEAIVAVYSDWGIGAGGTQPVVLKADRRHFRELTGDAAVIVGRKTLADFPGGRPLRGRHNIVISRQALEIEGAELVHSYEEALAAGQRFERCLVLGGASVFKGMLPYIDTVHVTKIELCPLSDSFFPNLDRAEDFHLVSESDVFEEAGIKFRFVEYRRK